MNRYIVVQWPEIQEFMMYPEFQSHSYLINDDKGMIDFGSSAYFIDEDFYNKVTREFYKNKHQQTNLWK